MSAGLTPRAQQLLAAVEREAEERRHALSAEPAPAPVRAAALRVDTALLTAFELWAAGYARGDVARPLCDEHSLDDPEPVLDAVFGPEVSRGPAAPPRPARTARTARR